MAHRRATGHVFDYGRVVSVRPSKPGSVDLLVVAAYGPELYGMRRHLGDELFGSVSGVAVTCKTVGIGLPNAASGTTARLLQLQPRAVVLIGTCGFYPEISGAPAIGEAVVARKLRLVEAIELEDRGAMPDPMARALEANAMISLGLGSGRAPSHDVANTLSITTDDALARVLGQGSGCSVENLEAFAVANACALQQVPFACVLGVSNQVGSMGREEWRANHKPAALAACEIVNRWLTTGAMGLRHRPA